MQRPTMIGKVRVLPEDFESAETITTGYTKILEERVGVVNHSITSFTRWLLGEKKDGALKITSIRNPMLPKTLSLRLPSLPSKEGILDILEAFNTALEDTFINHLKFNTCTEIRKKSEGQSGSSLFKDKPWYNEEFEFMAQYNSEEAFLLPEDTFLPSIKNPELREKVESTLKTVLRSEEQVLKCRRRSLSKGRPHHFTFVTTGNDMLLIATLSADANFNSPSFCEMYEAPSATVYSRCFQDYKAVVHGGVRLSFSNILHFSDIRVELLRAKVQAKYSTTLVALIHWAAANLSVSEFTKYLRIMPSVAIALMDDVSFITTALGNRDEYSDTLVASIFSEKKETTSESWEACCVRPFSSVNYLGYEEGTDIYKGYIEDLVTNRNSLIAMANILERYKETHASELLHMVEYSAYQPILHEKFPSRRHHTPDLSKTLAHYSMYRCEADHKLESKNCVYDPTEFDIDSSGPESSEVSELQNAYNELPKMGGLSVTRYHDTVLNDIYFTNSKNIRGKLVIQYTGTLYQGVVQDRVSAYKRYLAKKAEIFKGVYRKLNALPTVGLIDLNVRLNTLRLNTHLGLVTGSRSETASITRNRICTDLYKKNSSPDLPEFLPDYLVFLKVKDTLGMAPLHIPVFQGVINGVITVMLPRSRETIDFLCEVYSVGKNNYLEATGMLTKHVRNCQTSIEVLLTEYLMGSLHLRFTCQETGEERVSTSDNVFITEKLPRSGVIAEFLQPGLDSFQYMGDVDFTDILSGVAELPTILEGYTGEEEDRFAVFMLRSSRVSRLVLRSVDTAEILGIPKEDIDEYKTTADNYRLKSVFSLAPKIIQHNKVEE